MNSASKAAIVRQSRRIAKAVVYGDLALEIPALLLDEVRQDVDVLLVQGRDQVDAEGATLEHDQDLKLRIGILWVDAGVLGHHGSRLRRSLGWADHHISGRNDALMRDAAIDNDRAFMSESDRYLAEAVGAAQASSWTDAW